MAKQVVVPGVVLEESGLRFEFQPDVAAFVSDGDPVMLKLIGSVNSQVSKIAKIRRKGIQSRGIKCCDFVAVQGDVLYLIEVKNYNHPSPKAKKDQVPKQIAHQLLLKAHDTLAALLLLELRSRGAHSQAEHTSEELERILQLMPGVREVRFMVHVEFANRLMLPVLLAHLNDTLARVQRRKVAISKGSTESLSRTAAEYGSSFFQELFSLHWSSSGFPTPPDPLRAVTQAD